MVNYDAWRYADDEIRRDFLVNINQELKDKDLYDGPAPDVNPDKFKVDLETTTKPPPEINWQAGWPAINNSLK